MHIDVCAACKTRAVYILYINTLRVIVKSSYFWGFSAHFDCLLEFGLGVLVAIFTKFSTIVSIQI